MPYQPINPVPHNIGIEANKDNYDFSFTVDKYDKVEKVELRIYDLYNNNRHLYTITRSYNENMQYIQIYDEVNKVDLLNRQLSESELSDFSKLPLIGGKDDEEDFYLPLGLLDGYDATALFKGNKKYAWNVKLTGAKYDVWITENNTFADKESSLPTIYVPNNTRMEVNQQIVLGGEFAYKINNIDTYSKEGKIYYRQSKGKSSNVLNYFCTLNGYITYKGTSNVTSAIVDDDVLPFLRESTKFEVTDVALEIGTQTITGINIDTKTITFTPGFTAQTTDGNTTYENLITIVTNEEGTEGALITTGMIPSEWIYVFKESTIFFYNGTKQEVTEINPVDYSIKFTPGFISTKEGDLTANINLSKANNILPSDLTDYEILIVGDKNMKDKFTGEDADLTDMHITLNFINYFKVEKIQQYPNNTITDYSNYGLTEDEILFKVTATEIITPTKYQVDSPDLAKDYLLERQSSILTVDVSDLLGDNTIIPNQSFIIYANYIISPYYYFSVLPEKKVEFFLEDNGVLKEPDILTNSFNIKSTRAKIIAKYDGNIAYYTWKLIYNKSEIEEEIIEQTQEQFTSYMEYEYEMLEIGNYTLQLIITTEEGCIIQSSVILKVDYKILNNPFEAIAEADCDKKAIKISFSDFKQIKGYVYEKTQQNQYVLIGDNEELKALDGFEITKERNDKNEYYYNCYVKPGYKLQWDRIMPLESKRYIDIPKDFTMISRFKLGSNFSGDILQLVDADNTSYSLSLEITTEQDESGKDIFKLNFIIKKGTNLKTVTDNLYTDSQLELQTNTELESQTDIYYYYFDFNNMTGDTELDFNSDSSWFIVETDPLEDIWFTMVMRKSENSEGKISKIEIYKGDINEESTPNYELELPIESYESNYNKIMTYGNINWNYIQIFNEIITEEQIKEILYQNNYTPTWNEDTYMMMNFMSDNLPNINIDAIPLDTEYVMGTLNKFVIFRSEIQDNGQVTIKRKIAEIQASRTVFYDYAVEKKRKYIYTLVPYFSKTYYDESGNPYQDIIAGAVMNTDENGVLLNYDYISLYSGISLYLNESLNADGVLKQKENTYLLDNTQKVWYFKYNLDSGDITVNTDKNVFDGLFPYAKVGKGLKNYRTGSITALIGEFKENSNRFSSLMYYDSIKMANEFQDFCNSNTVKILRDEMGNVIPVDITLKNIKYDIKSIPSTIMVTFEWTQVDSYETIALFDIDNREDN